MAIANIIYIVALPDAGVYGRGVNADGISTFLKASANPVLTAAFAIKFMCIS